MKEMNKESGVEVVPSLFKVEVFNIHPLYWILDSKDPEDREDIPYIGTDRVSLDRAYEVYVLEWTEAMRLVREAVETQHDLYCIRVHVIPLNVRIKDLDIMYEESGTWKVLVFNSEGDKIEIHTCNGHRPGDIVEYFDPEGEEIQLAIVYRCPDFSREDGNDEFKLLLRSGDNGPVSTPASYVSSPSFQVSDTFRKELEEVYRKKLDEVEKGIIPFSELLDLL